MVRAAALSVAFLGLATAAHAQLVVDNDPYKTFSQATITVQIAPATAFSHYCHTGGVLKLWGVKERDGSPGGVGMSVMLHTLRSPSRIDVDVLGGLPLDRPTHDTGNYDCHGGGCHNDALATYQVPDETLAAIRKAGDLPLRITAGGCQFEQHLTAAQIGDLDRWFGEPRR